MQAGRRAELFSAGPVSIPLYPVKRRKTKILLCLSTGKELNDPTRMLYSKQEWFKTREEMNEIFADVPEALSNSSL